MKEDDRAVYMTDSVGQSPSWEADRSWRNKIPQLLWNLRVHSRIVSQSSVRSIQSTLPHLTFWISVLILSSHLPRGYSNGIFPSRFPTKSLYTPLLRTCYMPRPSRSWFDHHVIWRGVQIIKLLIMWSSSLPCYLVLLRPYASRKFMPIKFVS